MEAMPCKGQGDDECCDDTGYEGGSTCGELVHGGPKVCRPQCHITGEVCKSHDECCNKMCHIAKTGPGTEGIGFCMPERGVACAVLVSNLSSERRVTRRVLAPLLAELELGSELQGLP